MKQIQLKEFTVNIKTEITYGMNEAIKAEVASAISISTETKEQLEKGGEGDIKINGAAILASKYKTAEVLIESIKDKEGNDVPFTRKWIESLSIADGEMLEEAINNVRKEAEKK